MIEGYSKIRIIEDVTRYGDIIKEGSIIELDDYELKQKFNRCEYILLESGIPSFFKETEVEQIQIIEVKEKLPFANEIKLDQKKRGRKKVEQEKLPQYRDVFK